MTKAEKAKVFMNGRSQAVRIPADYRLSTDEVFVRRDPQSGSLTLSESPGEWADLLRRWMRLAFQTTSWPTGRRACRW